MLAADSDAAPGTVARPAFTVDAVPAAEEGQRVTVRGPVDITTAEEFGRRLSGATRGGLLPVTVDLTGVTHLASAGVQILPLLRDQLTAHGQRLTPVAPPGTAARAVLELVHLDADG